MTDPTTTPTAVAIPAPTVIAVPPTPAVIAAPTVVAVPVEPTTAPATTTVKETSTEKISAVEKTAATVEKPTTTKTESSPVSLNDHESFHDLLKLKLSELQALCEEAKVDSKGKKVFLLGRLLKAFKKVDEEELNTFTTQELKDFCIANNVNTKGNKKDFIAKLLAFREGLPIPEPAPTETKRRRESKNYNGDDSEEGESAESGGETEPKRARTSTASTTTPSKKDKKPMVEEMQKLKVIIDTEERDVEPSSSRTFTGWKGAYVQKIDGHNYVIDLKIQLAKSK